MTSRGGRKSSTYGPWRTLADSEREVIHCLLISGSTWPIDTPHGLKPDGCSVLRRGQRHASPKPLPAALSILGGVVVPVQARPTVRAGVPAEGQPLLDQHAAARARLAGGGRRHGD